MMMGVLAYNYYLGMVACVCVFMCMYVGQRGLQAVKRRAELGLILKSRALRRDDARNSILLFGLSGLCVCVCYVHLRGL